MDFLQQNWAWMSSNPWGSLGLALLCFGLGWGAARLLYHERLEVLKEKGHAHAGPVPSTTFSYPQHGRHGKNILSNSVNDVALDEHVSLRAEIPASSRMYVEIRGPKPEDLGDTEVSWFFSLGQTINWTSSKYDVAGGGKQSFSAESGIADMQLRFARPGDVQIVAYEGASQTPAWSKTLHVHTSAQSSA
ncbi:hypothetical protein [Luteimonas sp. A478]